MKLIDCRFSEPSGGFRFWTRPACRSALLALLLLLPTVTAEMVTIPNGAETQENQYNIGEPFSRSGNIISQQLYSSSLFPELSSAGQFLRLDALGFRLSSQGTISFPSEATFDRVEVLLSTANGPFSASLEQNHGDNVFVVYDQALTLSGNVPPGTTPSNFDLQISFTTPFLYNPSEGALVVEIRKYGGGETLSGLAGADIPGSTFYFDRGFGVQTLNNAGLETRFSYQVVPEPTTSLILLCGAVALWLARRSQA
jgi:hypothetical protein